MKRNNLLFLLTIILVFTLAFATACDSKECEHQTTNKQYTLITQATETTVGSASYVCSLCNETVTDEIPVLTDTSYWSAQTTPATHESKGSIVYTSTYWSVTVELAQGSHDYTGANWTLTTEPTETATGIATRPCECGHVDEVIVPVLTDTTVWTVTTTPADHNNDGSNVYTSVYGTVTVVIPKGEHNYENATWVLVTVPTATQTGTATHTCTCGYVEQVEVAVLTDTTVWTKNTAHADYLVANCTTAGMDVFESVYGTVKVETAIDATNHDWATDFTVDVAATCTTDGSKSKHCSRCDATTEVTVIPATGHSYANATWTLTVAPTVDTLGTATRKCDNCDYVDNKTDVPLLTDTTVWTKTSVAPTYQSAGKDTYVSADFGTVEVDIARLVAPYENKTYQNIEVDADNDNGGFKVGQITSFGGWSNANIVLTNNVGSGTAYPFRGNFKFTVVNDVTGEIAIEQYDLYDTEMTGAITKTITAYMDWNTGIFVMQRSSSWLDVLVIVPHETSLDSSNMLAYSWAGGLAITYNDGTLASNFFVTATGVYTNVSFLSGDSLLTADAVHSASQVVIKQGDVIVASFATKDGALIQTDGLEGTYTNATLGTVVVDGVGGVLLTVGANSFTGTYTVNNGAVSAVINSLGYNGGAQYYDVTLDATAGTFNAVAKQVTITFANANTINPAIPAPTDVTLPVWSADTNGNLPSANIAYALPTVGESATHVFAGWVDSNGNSVADPFATTESVTLYALWQSKVIVNVVGLSTDTGIDGTETLYVGAGSTFADVLAKYTFTTNDVVKKIFVGWYTDADFQTELNTAELVSVPTTIYAKWDNFHAMYGSYVGGNLYKNSGSGISGGSFGGKSVTIDAYGNISGSIGSGKIILGEDGKFTYDVGGTIKVGYFDVANGVIVTKYNGSTTITSDTDIYIRKADGDSITTNNTTDSYVAEAYTKFHRFTITNGDDTRTLVIVVIVEQGNTVNYANVYTFVDASVVPATMSDIAKDGTVVSLVDARGNTFIRGFSNGKLVELDGLQGTYTDAVLGEVVLNGVGAITFGGNTGSYTATDVANTYDVYITENAVDAYYSLVIDGANCTLTKVNVMVTFTSAHGFATADGTIESALTVNKNIAITLPVLLDTETHFFRGWYLATDDNKATVKTHTPVENVEFVALWIEKVTLTVVLGNSLETQTQIYGAGDKVSVETPDVTNGIVFSHWSLTDGGEAITLGTITENTTIYAVWSTPYTMAGSYNRTNVYQNSSNNTKDGTITSTSVSVVIDADGKISKGKNGGVIGVAGKEVTNGAIDFAGTYGWYNKELGLLIYGYKTSTTSLGTDTYVCFDLNAGITNVEWTISNYGGKLAMWFVIHFGETTKTAVVVDDILYANVSWGTASTIDEAKVDHTISANGVGIFARSSGAIVSLDGYQGTYSNGTTDLEIDGFGGWTMGDQAGSYAILANNKLGLTTTDGSAYYEVTLNDTAYTLAKLTANVTFTTAHGTAPEAQSLNIKVTHTLPVIADTDTHVFRGWQVNGEGDVLATITPADTTAISLVAKWDEKVVLTVVNGNGLENDTYTFGSGDVVDLSDYEPEYKDGKAFKHWSTTENGDADVTLTTITASTTIYAVWQDAHAMYGSYTGIYIYDNTILTANKVFAVATDGETTGVKEGTITNYDATTGLFTVDRSFGWYDATNGIIVISNNSADKVGTSLYILFRNATTVKGADTNYNSCAYWMEQHTRLLNLEIDGIDHLVFLFNNKVYFDVTYTSTDGELAVNAVRNANDLKVYANDGTIIADFIKTSSGLLPLDGFQGTYTTADSKQVVIDGVGNITIDSIPGTYTVVDGVISAVTVVGATKTLYAITVDGTTATVAVTGTEVIKFTVTSSNCKTTSGVDGELPVTVKTTNSHSSTGSYKLTFNVAMTVTLDWVISSESGWDMGYIKHNGSSKVSGVSGDDSGSVTITVAAGDTIEISYEKDGSGSEGNDNFVVTITEVVG